MNLIPLKQYAFFRSENLGWQEYMLVVEPDEHVSNMVVAEREAFQNKYGEMNVDCSNIYIKVASFLGNESMEQTVIRWIERICLRQQCFELSLNNYSGFPQHSIYLRIQEMTPLQTLFQQLCIIDNLISASGHLQMAFKPNIAIARQLPAEVYNRAISEYSRKTFHESFVVSRMLLIKMDRAYGTVKVVNVFGFTPTLDIVKN